MSESSTCDYLPTVDWWSYDIPTMNFKSEDDFNVFYGKVCHIVGEHESNFNNAVYGQRKLYLDYVSQNEPFDKFFESFKTNYRDYEKGSRTCLGRAVDIKILLRERLVSTYPDIEKCVYVVTSADCDWEWNSDGEPSEYLHIYNFMAHCMPTIKCKFDGKTAYVIMEIKLRFDNPLLIFENETRLFESRSKVRMLCQSRGSRYVEILKMVTGKEKALDPNKTHYAVFVGGAMLNLDNLMKLTCLPFVPFYKYRIRDGVAQAIIVGNLNKDYFRFTRKSEDSDNKDDYSFNRIPVEYFRNHESVVEEFESEISKVSLLLGESCEDIKLYLYFLARMKGDEDFIKETILFKDVLRRKRYEYVQLLKSNLAN